MVKNIFLFPLLFFALSLSLASCVNDDDEVEIDEEWKALQEKYFSDAVAGKEYYELSSQSGNGKILWKNSDEIETSEEESKLRIAVDGKPEFTDTVVARYEGWYFDKEGKKKIFDSTESQSLRSQLYYMYGSSPSPDPNKIPGKFAVNPNTASSAATGYVGGVIDGWSTILQEMKVGDEREVVIPQRLGYASSVVPVTINNTSYTLVPAYTTLWFRIKLLKIIPMAGYSS